MNEVRTTALNTQVNIQPASSKGKDNTQGRLVETENVSPKDDNAKVNQDASQGNAPENLEKAVASINDYVQVVQRDLHFSVDEDLEKTVIKVVDTHSGELIRQIPDDVFLELARKLKEDGELHLVNALG